MKNEFYVTACRFHVKDRNKLLIQEATGLKGEVISAMQDLEKVYRQLDQI